MLEVSWIADFADFRIDYTRFSLITLAKKREISYREISVSQARHDGVPETLLSELREGLSCFLVRKNGRTLRVLIDTADGFTGFSSAIRDADLYFTVAFLPSLFVEKKGITRRPWQAQYPLEHYQEKAEQLIRDFGDHFHKVRRFIPHQFLMWDTRAQGFWIYWRKAKKVLQRIRYSRFNPVSQATFWTFQRRYDSIQALRQLPLLYDIAAIDAFWAWPGHRLEIHRRLLELKKKGYQIFSKMNVPAEVRDVDLGAHAEEKRKLLPEVSRPVHLERPYEEMIGASRLFIFASGKHWGWREIGFIAFACGVPILIEPPVYEPYFPITRFRLFFTANEWEEIEDCLKAITQEEWNVIRAHNQRTFDETCAPLPLARYLAQEWERLL